MAPHFLDVPFVFQTLAESAAPVGPAGAEVTALAAPGATWAAFAETRILDAGDEGLGPWPDHHGEQRPALLISPMPKVAEDVLSADLAATANVVERIRAASPVGETVPSGGVG